MTRPRPNLSRLMADYGMFLILLLLCGLFSYLTWEEQHPSGADGARRLARLLEREGSHSGVALVVAADGEKEREFATTLAPLLRRMGYEVSEPAVGHPNDAVGALERLVAARKPPSLIALSHSARQWPVFDSLPGRYPALASARIATPPTYHWPNFLKAKNLANIADQIVVIAILAVGMTMVIITGGIDLSVGSLIALSAVVSTLLIRSFAGAENATAGGMVLCCLGGIAVCGAVGAVSGVIVTFAGVPAFIATLGMMLAASGLAYLLAEGQSIYQVPDAFTWLGRGFAVPGVANAVVLLVVLYAGAHVMMSRTVLGRYIYAVGGNAEAARLSGVPVKRVLLFVYTASGILAGLGGVVTASQLKSGSPTYGLMYELYTIAAVIVGGTSLSGGEGKILGTLIGAFIIAVIQNGMNLTGVESYTQKVVLGLVILGAVLLDRLKQRGFSLFRRTA